MLGGLPTPLDPFEARRLLFALTLLSVLANERVIAAGAVGDEHQDVAPPAPGRAAGRRRHVRPPRSC